MTPRDGALSLRRRHPADRTAAITGWIPVPLEKHNGTNGEKNLGVGVGSVRTGIVSWRTNHSLCRVSTTPTALRIHPPAGYVRSIFNKLNGKEVTPSFLLVFQPKIQS